MKIFTAVVAAAFGLSIVGCASGTSTEATGAASTLAPTTVSRPVVPPPPPLPSRPAGKSLEEIVAGIVLVRSGQHGALLDESEWSSLSSTICSDLAAGGTGLFLSQSAAALPAEEQWGLVDLYLEGATQGACTDAKKPPAPAGKYYTSDMGWSVITAIRFDLDETDLEYMRLLTEYSGDLIQYGQRYNVDVSGLLAAVDVYFSNSAGSVRCADGWVSSSGGKQGACSHHGGLQ